MLKGERTRLQRYAIESTPARVYEGCCTWFTILVLSAPKWLSGTWEPFFVQFHRTVVAPDLSWVSWQQEEEKWYFSVVDVVGALTEQPTPKRASTYWAVLKNRLKKEGAGELLTTCKQLKLRAPD